MMTSCLDAVGIVRLRHSTLSFACLVFLPNILLTSALPILNYTWLALMLSSIYHHQNPTNKALIVADQTAVFNMVYQHGRLVLLCPSWLVAWYVTTIAYTATWYYPAKLGRIQEHLHLPLHLVTYVATSMCGIFMARHLSTIEYK